MNTTLKRISFLILASFVFLLPDVSFAGGSGVIKIQTSRGEVPFKVEYAISPEEKAKGLMFRKELPKKHGMMFIYQTPTNVTMWMKNTFISLDMLFVNDQGRIKYIEEKTEPKSLRQIHSRGKVSAVIELPAGSVEDHGIKVGDAVILQ